MSIKEKSSERIQAQVVDFAIDSLKDHHKDVSAYFLNNVGKIAASGMVDVPVPTETRKLEKVNDKWIWQTYHDTDTVSASEYRSYFKENPEQRNEKNSLREKYLNEYLKYKASVGVILDELREDVTSWKEHALFAGAGTNSAAFSFEQDGMEYIAKVSHGGSRDAQAADRRLFDLEPGKDIPHLEQLAAISYVDGVTIVERLPGKDMFHNSIEMTRNVKDGQLITAIATMKHAHEAGVAFDPKPANFLYDKDQGFGFIDYHQLADDTQDTYQRKLQDFATILCSFGKRYDFFNNDDDYKMSAEQYSAIIPVIEAYRAVLLRVETPENYQQAIQEIDDKIKFMASHVRNVYTPGWIENKMKENHEIKESNRKEAERIRERQANGFGDFV
ncbi:MAG: hypothetical protein WAW80_05315 [Candidatus Saccharimonadales bacterium]